MSTLLVETQAPTSQLYFEWGHNEPETIVGSPQSQIQSAADAARDAAPVTQSQAVAEPFRRVPLGVEARSRTAIPSPPSKLAHKRGDGPVRLGSVMIRLLKQYGITDEEIAEGLESYAQKHIGRVAS